MLFIQKWKEANCTTFVFVYSPREALHVSQFKIIIINFIAGLGETHSRSETRSETICFLSLLDPLYSQRTSLILEFFLAVHLSVFVIWLLLHYHQLHTKPVIQANTAAVQPVWQIFAFPSKHSKDICILSSFQTRNLSIGRGINHHRDVAPSMFMHSTTDMVG